MEGNVGFPPVSHEAGDTGRVEGRPPATKTTFEDRVPAEGSRTPTRASNKEKCQNMALGALGATFFMLGIFGLSIPGVIVLAANVPKVGGPMLYSGLFSTMLGGALWQASKK